MSRPDPIPRGLALLAPLLLAGMGSLPPLPSSGAAATPFVCTLDLAGQGRSTTIEARLTARAAVTGTYALHVEGSGNSLGQSGDFEAAAGETVVLGEATWPGSPTSLDARLEVTVGGTTTDCPRGE